MKPKKNLKRLIKTITSLSDNPLIMIRFAKKIIMRKLILATGTFFLVAVLFSSCKSHKSCPAYSAVDTEQTEKLPA